MCSVRTDPTATSGGETASTGEVAVSSARQCKIIYLDMDAFYFLSNSVTIRNGAKAGRAQSLAKTKAVLSLLPTVLRDQCLIAIEKSRSFSARPRPGSLSAACSC
jgi:hypothetical protein